MSRYLDLRHNLKHKIVIPTLLLLLVIFLITFVSSYFQLKMQQQTYKISHRFHEIEEVRNIETAVNNIVQSYLSYTLSNSSQAKAHFSSNIKNIDHLLEELNKMAVVNTEERELLDAINKHVTSIKEQSSVLFSTSSTKTQLESIDILLKTSVFSLDKILASWHNEEKEEIEKITLLSEKTQTDYKIVMVILLGGIFLVIVGNSLYYNKILTKRILLINNGTGEFSNGNLKHRINVTGEDELSDTAYNINAMAATLELYNNKLEELARKDNLTGLLNRHAMEEILEHELARSIRDKSPLSILMLDIDNFKNINDSYGHAVGDYVLKHLAICLNEISRICDYIFRVGGEEFIILTPNNSLDGTQINAGRICKGVESYFFQHEKIKMDITVSIGVVTSEGKNYSKKELLEKVDQALYAAKNAGKNCYKTYKE